MPIRNTPLVAALLAFSLRRSRLGKFDVQLTVAKRIAGGNVAGLGDDFHVAVLDLPCRGLAIFVDPVRQVLCRQTERQRRKEPFPPFLACSRFPASMTGGIRAIEIVNLPFHVELVHGEMNEGK